MSKQFLCSPLLVPRGKFCYTEIIREWKENAGNFRPAEDESMDKIIIRPMTPEDWGAVSRIYVEGIATEYATFQTECRPIPRGTLPTQRSAVLGHPFRRGGWAWVVWLCTRVDPRWCYRGVAEVSIYVASSSVGTDWAFSC